MPAPLTRPVANFGVNWESPQAQGLIAWWTFGSRGAVDMIRRFGGTVSGAVDFNVPLRDPLVGTGAEFVAVANIATERINLSDNLSFQATSQIAVMAWADLRTLPSGNPNVRTLWKKDQNYILRLVSGASRESAGASPVLSLLWWDGTDLRKMIYGSPTTGVHHYIGVVSGNDCSALYQDGVQVGGASSVHTAATGRVLTNAPTIGGSSTGGESWDGVIGEVRVYAALRHPAWIFYDPSSRFDLYWVPSRRAFFDVSAAAFNAAWARGSNNLIGGGVAL